MHKMLARALSTREKALLLVLAAVLLACLYYLAVWKPSTDIEARSRTELDEIADVMVVEEAVAAQCAQLRAEIAAAQGRGVVAKTLPESDNTKALMNELNAILGSSRSFNIAFEGVEQAAGIVRRVVRVSFSAPTYAEAETVLRRLMDSAYSCQVTDFSITQGGASAFSTETPDVTATALVTYFEVRPDEVAAPGSASA